jgi:hypothetical protein
LQMGERKKRPHGPRRLASSLLPRHTTAAAATVPSSLLNRAPQNTPALRTLSRSLLCALSLSPSPHQPRHSRLPSSPPSSSLSSCQIGAAATTDPIHIGSIASHISHSKPSNHTPIRSHRQRGERERGGWVRRKMMRDIYY